MKIKCNGTIDAIISTSFIDEFEIDFDKLCAFVQDELDHYLDNGYAKEKFDFKYCIEDYLYLDTMITEAIMESILESIDKRYPYKVLDYEVDEFTPEYESFDEIIKLLKKELKPLLKQKED